MLPSIPWLILALTGVVSSSPAVNLAPRQTQTQASVVPMASVSAALKSKGANASCNDLEYGGYKPDPSWWDLLNTTAELNNWFNNWTPSTPGNATWLWDFTRGSQHGAGYQHCTVADKCSTPSCLDWTNPDGSSGAAAIGTGWQELVWLSAANYNQFMSIIYQGVGDAYNKFSGTQTDITTTFYGDPPNTLFAEREALNALGAAYGAVWALAGPFGGAVGAILTGAFTAGVLALDSPNEADEALEHNNILEEFAESWVNITKPWIETVNYDLVVGNGVYGDPKNGGTNVTQLFADGKWAGAQNIPVVQGTFQYTDVSEVFYQVLVAGLINFAWKKQDTYISCHPMSQSDFNTIQANAGHNDGRLKAYVNGHGCYYQSVLPATFLGTNWPYTQNPVGWGALSNGEANPLYQLKSEEIIISSFLGYQQYGNNYTAASNNTLNYINSILQNGAGTSGVNYTAVFTTPGFFNIPICYTDNNDVEQSTFFKHLGKPDTHDQRPQPYSWCDCYNSKDINGLKFSDVVPVVNNKKWYTSDLNGCGKAAGNPDNPNY